MTTPCLLSLRCKFHPFLYADPDSASAMADFSLSYSKATIYDASMLQSFVEAGFRASDTRPGWTGDLPQLNATFTMDLKALQAELINPDGAILIAREDSLSDSVVACFNIARKSSDVARFAWFVVAKEYQQRGIGRKVLAYAEEYAQRTWNSVRKLELNALSNRRELISWYERNGYSRTGVVIPFPANIHPIESLPANLGFVMLEKDLRVRQN
ncbi:hypothetical protein, variant [Verruconis gallopava]|uniref:N-acetyltransferase domain-containing protein n=1 Tax=Verruconis gallopava TaxID=253628 RepID=A0A0D2AJJ9_9PEZI|nr:uncharacterized protein PV09_09201 [Verruconis gallopava]XP_016208974.1 hypothetical protein, variant [Verruconis gallopava]KIV99103.1 hypothetical protein PV09_09201 [Verruconis gallopava]KIV99104.1 hypothetical protein, variant [Verruconis gallopava]